MIKDWVLWLWDWAKRIFGRSKTIFTNVTGLILSMWVELYDPISMFDWTTVTDKHEVVMMITMSVAVINVIFKSFMQSGNANFRALPEMEPEVDEESLERSPKAE